MARYTSPEDRALAKMHAATTRGLAIDETAFDMYARRQAVVGHLGAQMGLDLVGGIVRCDIRDHGGKHGWVLAPGEVVVELRHACAPSELLERGQKTDAVIDEHRVAHVLVVPVHGVARLRDHIHRWWRLLWRVRA